MKGPLAASTSSFSSSYTNPQSKILGSSNPCFRCASINPIKPSDPLNPLVPGVLVLVLKLDRCAM